MLEITCIIIMLIALVVGVLGSGVLKGSAASTRIAKKDQSSLTYCNTQSN